jgi:hypothetical protein
MVFKKVLDSIYRKLLSDKVKERGERIILIIAIISFIIHLAIIYFKDFGLIALNSDSDLFKNPVAAIYTPFSFILIYEVYLLVYYLPRSITTYISKQYEIITLIIIRRLFKDLSSLELSSEWFQIKDDLQFTYDLIASIVLFYLLYLFYKKSRLRYMLPQQSKPNANISRFIDFKRLVAVCLVPVLIILAVYIFSSWSFNTFYGTEQTSVLFKDINNVFFDEFFTILIIVDVILLLLSFFHTNKFHKVIRNSGFVISTILIRLSFSVEGLINTLLIVVAVVFGLLILTIHNQYEKNIMENNVQK